MIVTSVTWSQVDGCHGEDWRSAVECIAIDPNYDGSTLRVALADAPLKRTQLVGGEYVLAAAMVGTKMAVRVTDIWGQETLVVQDVPVHENTGT